MGGLTRIVLLLGILAVLFSIFFAGWEVGSVVFLLLAAFCAAFFASWLSRRLGGRGNPRPHRRNGGWFGDSGGDGWGGGDGGGGGD